jgi:hypothetical protein
MAVRSCSTPKKHFFCFLYSFLLDGNNLSASYPSLFAPGEGARDLDAVNKFFSAGNRTRSFQPVAHRYTDWAVGVWGLNLRLCAEEKKKIQHTYILTNPLHLAVKLSQREINCGLLDYTARIKTCAVPGDVRSKGRLRQELMLASEFQTSTCRSRRGGWEGQSELKEESFGFCR